MSGFDVDSWLEKQDAKVSPSKSQGFDVDAFLLKKGDPEALARATGQAVGDIANKVGGKAKEYALAQAPKLADAVGEYLSKNKGSIIRGATSTLPYLGGAAGFVGGGGLGALEGLAGGPAAPITVPASALLNASAGGGLGYAGGKDLEELANHFILGDQVANTSVGDRVLKTGGDVLKGGAGSALLLAGATPAAQSVIAPAIGAAGNAASAIGRKAVSSTGETAKALLLGGAGALGANYLKEKYDQIKQRLHLGKGH